MNLNFTRRHAVVAVAVVGGLAVAGLLWRGGSGAGAPPPAKAQPKPSLTVTATTPQRTMLAVTLPANGNLAAWQEAVVGADTNGLRISEVRVNVGDRVRAGQVLATFAADTVRAELAQAHAGFAEAQAAAAEAAGNAQRARSLDATGALSASQVNQYLTAEQTAQARLQAARALMQVQEARLAQATVIAPDDGIVSARSATVGAVVNSGAELFRLIRKGRLEWRAEVTSGELGRLAAGTRALVTAASGARLEGRVRMIGPTVDPQSRIGLVYVDVSPLPGPGTALPGMFARGEFELGATPTVTVPQSAVAVREGFSYVFQLQPDNRVAQVKVQLGRLAGDRIEVVSGLAADARIAAAGAGFLNDGDLVRVVAAPAAAK